MLTSCRYLQYHNLHIYLPIYARAIYILKTLNHWIVYRGNCSERWDKFDGRPQSGTPYNIHPLPATLSHQFSLNPRIRLLHSPEPYSTLVWEVDSFTEPFLTYIVKCVYGSWTCTCPDHIYRMRNCKHIRLVIDRLRVAYAFS